MKLTAAALALTATVALTTIGPAAPASASVCATGPKAIVYVPLDTYETTDTVAAWIQTRHLCDGGRQTRVGFYGFAYTKGHRAVEFNPTPWRGRDIGVHRYLVQAKSFTSSWSPVWYSHSYDATYSADVTFDEVRSGDAHANTGTGRL